MQRHRIGQWQQGQQSASPQQHDGHCPQIADTFRESFGLVGYVVYVRLRTETYGGSDTRKYSTTWDINLVTVKGQQKGKGYCFAVAALNTQEEGQRSTEVCAEAERTPPVAVRLLL